MTPMVRLATLSDLDPIREIYNYYVVHSTCTYQLEPDTVDERLAWFQERGAKHPVTVVDVGGVVVGWAALSPWKSRCGYAYSAEASVYVHHECHRCGYGRMLLLDIVERAKGLGLHTIIGGASADQEASIALQIALGFEQVAHFKQVGYKFGRWLDVIYTQYILDGTPENAQNVSKCTR